VTRSAPAWLEDFQRRFGDVVRTPLDRASGTLTATPERYDPRTVAESVGGHEPLAVYNRQYWFRLFDAMQSAFPLVCRLLGHWAFNDHAARYLLDCPPRGWDLDEVPDRFEAWLADALDEQAHAERPALLEAARIDAAFREVFRAPTEAPFHPSAEDAARLLDARLVPSRAVAIVTEHRPLLDLRRSILGSTSEKRVPLPPLGTTRAVAIARTDAGTAEIPLEAREAELLALLREHAVRDALGRLEAACSPEERAALPTKTRTWLARAVQRGFWAGLRFER
jgi:hypothetical protein